jgi:hypothetical protein
MPTRSTPRRDRRASSTSISDSLPLVLAFSSGAARTVASCVFVVVFIYYCLAGGGSAARDDRKGA